MAGRPGRGTEWPGASCPDQHGWPVPQTGPAEHTPCLRVSRCQASDPSCPSAPTPSGLRPQRPPFPPAGMGGASSLRAGTGVRQTGGLLGAGSFFPAVQTPKSGAAGRGSVWPERWPVGLKVSPGGRARGNAGGSRPRAEWAGPLVSTRPPPAACPGRRGAAQSSHVCPSDPERGHQQRGRGISCPGWLCQWWQAVAERRQDAPENTVGHLPGPKGSEQLLGHRLSSRSTPLSVWGQRETDPPYETLLFPCLPASSPRLVSPRLGRVAMGHALASGTRAT